MLNGTQSLEGHSDVVWSLAWSPSGNHLASSSADKTIRIWGLKGDNWVCIETIDGVHSRTVRSVCWSPCGRFLTSCGFDAMTAVYQCKTSGEIEHIATLEGHENEVKCVAWEATSTLIATCSRDKSIWIWEAIESDMIEGGDATTTDFECVSVLQGHSQDVKHVVWHPHTQILASSSYDDTIKFWAESEGEWFCEETLTNHSSTVWALSFDSQGERLVSCSDDGNIIIWKNFVNEATKKKKWHFVCSLQGSHTRPIYSIHWSGLSDLIVSGGGDNAISIFSRSESTVKMTDQDEDYDCIIKISDAHKSDVNCVKWNPVRVGVLASACEDGTIRIWKFSQP
eukprot:c16176_g1_i1.p1 GENE.c16176_g1_i1~~c16176_g1_i1.p1  ORF type:complete len:351 (-),score=165.93 c16176_g1_i1:29-1048(-)